MKTNDTLFTPPHPSRLPSIAALARTIWRGGGDLLSLLPGAAYRMKAGELGYSRRSIKLFNDPVLVKEILADKDEMFPKSDLMVGALEPLIGDSIFVSDGAKWRRQRSMIDPAFSMMRLSIAFKAIMAAIDDFEARIEAIADKSGSMSLDLAMSHLTADIICRTVFSISLKSDVAKDVFHDFTIFEKGVGQVKLWRLIVSPAWAKVPQETEVLAACTRIRRHIGALIDTHMGDGADRFNDIASVIVKAQDKQTGEPFSREELIDQLGVFFLAGHETTASVLTWAFYILAAQPDIAERLRAEADAVFGDGPVHFEGTKKLLFARSVFRETLRLYPPITFMPRVALKAGRVGDYRIRKGALIMISPWTLHRHSKYWQDPDAFDPDRFMPERSAELTDGAYIPFGSGPHTCIGAGFALVESVVILARICQRFRFQFEASDKDIRPAARLTTRPVNEIWVRPKRAA
ncbi:MAG: cytochrome P450 [Pseudomonadota bacterium]